MTEDLNATRALEGRDRAPRRTILAWAMWDWGNQPFNSVIITFVFSVYLTSKAFGDTNFTSQALATSTSLAGLSVALLAPVLGQNSDRTGRTVHNLRWFTWSCAIVSGLMFFVLPDAGDALLGVPKYLLLGLVLLAVGSIANEIAGALYNSLIDEVASESTVGRISGFGWGMGYLGGITALLLLYFGFIKQPSLFGTTSAEAMGIRVSMVVCMIWQFVFTVPTFVTLRDRPRAVKRIGVVESYRLLAGSIVRLWRTSRNVLYFLVASALFRDGLTGIFAFGAVIAAGTFGFSAGDVIVFGAAANVVAGISTMAFGMLDDRLGPKRVILMSLIALSILGLAMFAFHDGGDVVFWVIGLSLAAFVGPAQAASRSFLARLVPLGRSGEVFGLYATTGRVVSFLSPAAFGLAIGLGAMVTGESNTQYWGILGIVVVLAAGLLLMLPVREDGNALHP